MKVIELTIQDDDKAIRDFPLQKCDSHRVVEILINVI
jgi:hypothetical protein